MFNDIEDLTEAVKFGFYVYLGEDTTGNKGNFEGTGYDLNDLKAAGGCFYGTITGATGIVTMVPYILLDDDTVLTGSAITVNTENATKWLGANEK